jgi:hypothetical protein
MAKRSKKRSSHQKKFAAAARACAGNTKGKFRVCMRKKLSK